MLLIVKTGAKQSDSISGAEWCNDDDDDYDDDLFFDDDDILFHDNGDNGADCDDRSLTK